MFLKFPSGIDEVKDMLTFRARVFCYALNTRKY